ncbi:MAG: LPS assembly lipoprotein LptE [Janthinobacterium lividum]
MKRRFAWTIVTCLLAATLAACGFQLQGRYDMPFKQLYIASGASPEMLVRIKRMVEHGSDTRVVSSVDQADAILSLSTQRSQSTLSLTFQGVVREFELDEWTTYSLTTPDGRVLVPPSTIRANRSMTYNAQFALAKQQEADLLYRDMELDMADQLLRRLAVIKTLTAPDPNASVLPAVQPRAPLPTPPL